MKIIYIAGRFRGPTHRDIQLNILAAEAAGLAVAAIGAMPLIPHKNTENFHGLLDDDFWIEGTKELLRRADALFLFDPEDEKRSTGTRGELEEAKKRSIPILRSLEDVQVFLDTSKQEV